MVDSINRNETVRTAEESLVMKIDSFAYKRLLFPLFRKDLEIKLFCLQRISFLKKFSVDDLIPVAYHLKPRAHKAGDHLLRKGAKPTELLLISEGICDVVWEPSDHQSFALQGKVKIKRNASSVQKTFESLDRPQHVSKIKSFDEESNNLGTSRTDTQQKQ